MNRSSLLLRCFLMCAAIAVPASILFPHLLNSTFEIAEMPHLFADLNFWLAWLPWYGAFLITSFIAGWAAIYCRSGTNSSDAYDEAPSGPREIGTVKWFNGKKGFGFITRESGEDVFVHHRSIRQQGKNRRFLNEGQRVEFTLTHKGKGPQAEDVIIL